MTKSALVLAGGGLAGIAWEVGILLGIRDGAPETFASIIDESTTFIGTSAGSAVAAQLATGSDVGDLWNAQVAGVDTELGAELDVEAWQADFAAALQGVTSAEEGRRRIGALALAAKTPTEADRRAAITGRLPVPVWPEHPLLITAVDAETGELRIFDRDSGADLIDVVGASCAVPGVWPTVTIQGARYMDGGVRSGANADLAAGADRILVVTPSAEDTAGPLQAVSPEHLRALEPGRVRVVYADDESISAFGANPLDPSITPAAARAGRAQGQRIAASVAEFWGE